MIDAINGDVAAGKLERAYADGVIMAIEESVVPPHPRQETANRIGRLPDDRREPINDTVKLLKKQQADFMKRKRRALLALSEAEWAALVGEDEDGQ